MQAASSCSLWQCGFGSLDVSVRFRSGHLLASAGDVPGITPRALLQVLANTELVTEPKCRQIDGLRTDLDSAELL